MRRQGNCCCYVTHNFCDSRIGVSSMNFAIRLQTVEERRSLKSALHEFSTATFRQERERVCNRICKFIEEHFCEKGPFFTAGFLSNLRDDLTGNSPYFRHNVCMGNTIIVTDGKRGGTYICIIHRYVFGKQLCHGLPGTVDGGYSAEPISKKTAASRLGGHGQSA